ncbi:MAG: Ig-like domain repeat protein [Chloroflexi bacterium]|nr:Ig-like domain repeat protein [Chloroflexota bacterium]
MVARRCTPRASGQTPAGMRSDWVGPGGGAPTGKEKLYEAAAPGTMVPASSPALAAQPLVNGTVTFNVLPLYPGKHTLLAIYSDDENFIAGAPARYDLMVKASAWTCYVPFAAAWKQP